jgi:hypothetical protein
MKNLLITSIIALFVSITYSQNIPSVNMPEHPRILLLKGQEEGIKQTIATNAVWKKVHQNILAECDKIIAKPAWSEFRKETTVGWTFEVTIPANTKYALTVLLIPENAIIKTGMPVPLLNEWLRK